MRWVKVWKEEMWEGGRDKESRESKKEGDAANNGVFWSVA